MECYAVGGQFLYTIPFYQKAIFGYDAQARAFLVKLIMHFERQSYFYKMLTYIIRRRTIFLGMIK